LQRCGGAAGDDGDAAGEDGERAFAVVVKPAECADFFDEFPVGEVEGACADGLEPLDDERDLAGLGVEVDAAAGDHLLAVFRGEGHFAGGVCEDGAGDGGLFVFEVKVPVRAFTEAGDFADDAEGVGHALLEGGVDACGELRDGDGLGRRVFAARPLWCWVAGAKRGRGPWRLPFSMGQTGGGAWPSARLPDSKR
jgi:hypothetical protein